MERPHCQIVKAVGSVPFQGSKIDFKTAQSDVLLWLTVMLEDSVAFDGCPERL